jgi:hypothetical protein
MNSGANHMGDLIYTERLSSNKTELLFLSLTFVFLLLSTSRVIIGKLDTLFIVWIAFFLLCCIYSVNYRTLTIRLTRLNLMLRFGIFIWTIPVDNIESISIDELPPIMKYGGAGIHFMTIRNRYRASFNFLEYPRVVIQLKRKRGLVKDISFSTKQPSDILGKIREAKSHNQSSN